MNEKQIFDILIYALFALAVITFISLFFTPAPYGRYTRAGWGPKINAKTAWVIQEAPSVIAFAVFFFLGIHSLRTVPLIFFVLWQIHYVNRTFVYPFKIRGGKQTTLITMILAFIFTLVNGYLNGRYLTHFSGGYSLQWLYDPRFIVGAIIFIKGMIINMHSDSILRNLRKHGESGYKIPRGGAFKYVSGANYFGEILEWTGWAIATWSLPGLCFAVFTAANLIPRAYSHHKWYRKEFPDYPKDRKAVIPFIF